MVAKTAAVPGICVVDLRHPLAEPLPAFAAGSHVDVALREHRDLFLTDEEHAANDCMTVCCSRAKSPLLVLDL